ncbi:MAG: hypothetical protein PF541_10880 [Prolixibacteraceae bacterium]|jgi:hypothetical protein|nr:hypothetical protein [Prolixibacteraceae bacterium]
MEEFNSDRNLQKIIKEFKRTDEFYSSFRHQFIISLFLIVKKHYKHLQLNEEMNNNLRLYADEILSCVESVTYKDSSYPAFRLEEELQMMTRIVVKVPNENQNPDFIEQVHLKAKEMMVLHYPDIVELSANGFRLLEKYSRMYNWEFVTGFYTKMI